MTDVVTGDWLKVGGVFVWEVYSHHPDDGGRIIERTKARNGICTAGITDMFEQYMRSGTGITPCIGLINSDGYASVSSADTMASHAGWTEVDDYSEATRPLWGADAASSATITNSIKVEFTVTAPMDVRGLLLTSDNTKNGTTGILWSTAIFGLVSSLQTDQVARASYSLSGIGA